MIIGIPSITEKEKTCQLSCKVEVNEEVREIWFEVEKEYGSYLCSDRADAFLIGLLSWAMRNKEDIVCEAPVTEMLLYNIETYLLPSVIKHAPRLYYPKIQAKTIPSVKISEGGGNVGASASLGVDSFHTIMNHWHTGFESMKITHLCLNNVGAYNSAYHAEKVRTAVIERAERAAEELNLKLLKTDSNFAQIFPQNHLLTNTYSSMFAVFCLQKLWKAYYYSSGSDFSHFSLKDNDLHDTAYYDLLLLDCFSLPNIKLYSEGATKTRFEKIQQVAQFPIAKKYLHVCIRKETNCGKCDKCKKTLLVLDAIGKLEEFGTVFNIEEYKKERDRYLGLTYLKQSIGNMYYKDIYKVLKNDKQMEQVIQRLKQQVESYIKGLEGKEIIIYVAGEIGLMLYTVLKQAGYDKVINWIDNQEGLAGMKKEGIPILSYKQWKEKAKELDLSKIGILIAAIRQRDNIIQEIKRDFGEQILIIKREDIVFDWLEDA